MLGAICGLTPLTQTMLWADPFRFAVPEPRRGGLIVAQGKAAEAAALGKKPPHPTSFVSSGLARLWHAKPEEKKEVILLGPQPRAALRLPGAIIISSLRDFSLARCARIAGELLFCDGQSFLPAENSPVPGCLSCLLSATSALNIKWLVRLLRSHRAWHGASIGRSRANRPARKGQAKLMADAFPRRRSQRACRGGQRPMEI